MAPLSEASLVFAAIAVIFYVVLILKSQLKLSVCSICIAVSSAWLALLVFRAIGWYEDDVLLAILMGMSVVGGYYLWERRTPKDLLVFRLPVLLLLAFIAWGVITLEINLGVLLVVVAVWLLHGLLYLYRNKPGLKPKIDKIIACCSSW